MKLFCKHKFKIKEINDMCTLRNIKSCYKCSKEIVTEHTLHDFGKWSDWGEGSNLIGAIFILQNRKCNKCGIVEWKRSEL